MSLLLAEQLYKSYPLDDGCLEILKGVDLAVEEGEIVAVRGPSGSGKSTLLNILGTLDQPDRGRVIVNGVEVNQLADEALSRFRNRNIGFIFQFHHLLPELTVWENLELPLWLAGKDAAGDRRFLESLLELTGLVDRQRHFPSQLSGGERQRVAVIRALINRPGIVLADEPTGNLDMENGQILMTLIKELRREYRQTFLVATHSDRLARTADRRLYLRDGLICVTPDIDDSPEHG
jgi:lipoprotein-releasing system ATP-binding protein